jgi:hypothetical protein
MVLNHEQTQFVLSEREYAARFSLPGFLLIDRLTWRSVCRLGRGCGRSGAAARLGR